MKNRLTISTTLFQLYITISPPLSCTPLPLHGLQELRDHVKHWREHRALQGLLEPIDDIERWLSCPLTHKNILKYMKEIAMAAMQEETQQQLRRIKKHSLAEVSSIIYFAAKKENETVDKEGESAYYTVEIQATAKHRREKDNRKDTGPAHHEVGFKVGAKEDYDEDVMWKAEEVMSQPDIKNSKASEPESACTKDRGLFQTVNKSVEQNTWTLQIQQQGDKQIVQDIIRAEEAEGKEPKTQQEYQKVAVQPLPVPLQHSSIP